MAPGHPECPERLTLTLAHLSSCGLLDDAHEVTPEPAALEDVARVHATEYIEAVENASASGGGWADVDTYISSGTWRAAMLASGAAVQGAEAVVSGRFDDALALVRPPGHHATRYSAKGFCIFNNVAVAAAALLARGQVARLAILDFDVHHGNGTQEAFYNDGRVIFVSFHRYPFYPGSGAASEEGEGPAEGLVINVPLRHDTPPSRYLELWEAVLSDRVRPFAPEVVLVSAGFDAYAQDPLAGMGFGLEDFGAIGRSISTLAHETRCGGSLTVLEGGYDLEGLPLCVEAYLDGLTSLTSGC
jgi:acetoin utilization deacetylase AcuC-like enzyme